MNLKDVFKNGDGKPLPKPNIEMRMSGDDEKGIPWTAEQVRGITCNPCYAGIGPFPALVSEKDWIHSAAREIETDGADQFLVNMLALLRQAFEKAQLDFE